MTVAATWVPDPQDVANVMLSRTDDEWGSQLGTWTNETTPSITEVARLIQVAAADVETYLIARLPSALDDNYQTVAGDGPFNESAKSVATYRVAMLVETAYFSKQIRNNTSAEVYYQRLYIEALDALNTHIEKYNAEFDTDQVPNLNDPNLPLFYFGDRCWSDQATFWGRVFY